MKQRDWMLVLIATLFELCERLQMHFIIAAPENVGQRHRLLRTGRKVFQNTEHVHVVGLPRICAATP
ncbi:hypothetical protein ACNKHL_05425 [Shigella flexneri]